MLIYEVTIAGQTHKVELSRNDGAWRCSLNGRAVPLDVISTQEGVLSLLIDGKSYEIKQENTASETRVVVGHQRFRAVVRDPRSLRSRRRSDSGSQGVRKVTASMPGT